MSRKYKKNNKNLTKNDTQFIPQQASHSNPASKDTPKYDNNSQSILHKTSSKNLKINQNFEKSKKVLTKPTKIPSKMKIKKVNTLNLKNKVNSSHKENKIIKTEELMTENRSVLFKHKISKNKVETKNNKLSIPSSKSNRQFELKLSNFILDSSFSIIVKNVLNAGWRTFTYFVLRNYLIKTNKNIECKVGIINYLNGYKLFTIDKSKTFMSPDFPIVQLNQSSPTVYINLFFNYHIVKCTQPKSYEAMLLTHCPNERSPYSNFNVSHVVCNISAQASIKMSDCEIKQPDSDTTEIESDRSNCTYKLFNLSQTVKTFIKKCTEFKNCICNYLTMEYNGFFLIDEKSTTLTKSFTVSTLCLVQTEVVRDDFGILKTNNILSLKSDSEKIPINQYRCNLNVWEDTIQFLNNISSKESTISSDIFDISYFSEHDSEQLSQFWSTTDDYNFVKPAVSNLFELKAKRSNHLTDKCTEDSLLLAETLLINCSVDDGGGDGDVVLMNENLDYVGDNIDNLQNATTDRQIFNRNSASYYSTEESKCAVESDKFDTLKIWDTSLDDENTILKVIANKYDRKCNSLLSGPCHNNQLTQQISLENSQSFDSENKWEMNKRCTSNKPVVEIEDPFDNIVENALNKCEDFENGIISVPDADKQITLYKNVGTSTSYLNLINNIKVSLINLCNDIFNTDFLISLSISLELFWNELQNDITELGNIAQFKLEEWKIIKEKITSLLTKLTKYPIKCYFKLKEYMQLLEETEKIIGKEILPSDFILLVENIQNKYHNEVRYLPICSKYIYIPDPDNSLTLGLLFANTSVNSGGKNSRCRNWHISNLEKNCYCRTNLLPLNHPRAANAPPNHRTLEILFDIMRGRPKKFIAGIYRVLSIIAANRHRYLGPFSVGPTVYKHPISRIAFK